jgi:hypothetical protein
VAVKSAYKTHAPTIPEIKEEPPQPSETTHIEFNGAGPAEPVATVEPATDTDEAGEALKRQLAALRQSEELQRLHAAQMAAPAPSLPAGRADRIALWRQHGLTDDDAAFLEAHPDMIDHPRVTQQAVAAAEHAGLQRGSDDFNTAVENNFATLMGRAEAQARPAAADPAGFFAPRPAPSPAAPDRAAMYSAPVSRQAYSGSTGQRPARQITLTPQEQEYARVAGVSDVEYARQKQRLAQAKANGDYGERR